MKKKQKKKRFDHQIKSGLSFERKKTRAGRKDDHASWAYRWWNGSMTSSIYPQTTAPFYYPHSERSGRDGDHPPLLCQCCPLLNRRWTTTFTLCSCHRGCFSLHFYILQTKCVQLTSVIDFANDFHDERVGSHCGHLTAACAHGMTVRGGERTQVLGATPQCGSDWFKINIRNISTKAAASKYTNSTHNAE